MLNLRDTLTGEKRELVPIADEVRLYVCGITPYSEAHLGHALFSIVFDVLRRYLEWRGYGVRHIQNFTDIDDKLIERSHETGTPVEELAERHSDAYMAQLTRLNVLAATEYPRATEEIPNIISFIEGLVEKGVAYASGGDVYYRVRDKADYGKLSKRDVDDLRSGARVDLSELKDDPLDFALWKGAKPGEPHWDSPWGPGRPGWHIECSAMAVNALGEQIDIHGGGADLIFPHHENEIAQSESFTGKAPFASFWMHNALLTLATRRCRSRSGTSSASTRCWTATGRTRCACSSLRVTTAVPSPSAKRRSTRRVPALNGFGRQRSPRERAAPKSRRSIRRKRRRDSPRPWTTT